MSSDDVSDDSSFLFPTRRSPRRHSSTKGQPNKKPDSQWRKRDVGKFHLPKSPSTPQREGRRSNQVKKKTPSSSTKKTTKNESEVDDHVLLFSRMITDKILEAKELLKPANAAAEDELEGDEDDDDDVDATFKIREIYIPDETVAVAGGSSNPKKKGGKKKKIIDEIVPTLKEMHRENFHQLNFPDGLDSIPKGSKHVSKSRVQLMVHIMLNWSERKEKLTKEEHKLGYTMHELNYSLRKELCADGKITFVPMRDDCRIVGNDEIYDYIYSAHVLVGHKRIASTFNKLKEKKLFTITEKDVSNFIHTCPTCLGSGVRAPAMKGAKKPIYSASF
jgi:hypothetical protein